MAPRYCILGAPADTGNLGLAALLTSIVVVLDQIDPGAEFVVFDNGYGTGTQMLDVGGNERMIRRVGARNTKRLYRSDALARMALTGRRIDSRVPGKEALRTADAVFDISGGDSFSDIYGWSRFTKVALHKLAALRQGRPLVMLPQTYGPFRSSAARVMAEMLTQRATVAMARDAWSYDQLCDLLGDHHDAARHLSGVDMAFALPASPVLTETQSLPASSSIAGINVSGLLYLDPQSTQRFGLADDYRRVIDRSLTLLLEKTDLAIVLTPHVNPELESPESDVRANALVKRRLDKWGDRVRLAPTLSSPCDAKGLIGSMDWFAGSRMHSTIAALSSCVPAAAIAYSSKAEGVFRSAGAQDEVIDLRLHRADEVADRLLDSYGRREATAANLRRDIPEVTQKVHEQVRWALQIARSVPQVGGAT